MEISPQSSSTATPRASTPNLNRPNGSSSSNSAIKNLPPSLAAKMQAIAQRGSSRSNPSPHRSQPSLPLSPIPPPSSPSPNSQSQILKRRLRPGFTLNDVLSASPKLPTDQQQNGQEEEEAPTSAANGLSVPNGRIESLRIQNSSLNSLGRGNVIATPFENLRKIVDPSGRLNFANKAVLHSRGVDFSTGASFAIKMEDLTLLEELGKGNYGTVQKVLFCPTKVTMAMKEIRLELEESKLKAIITELDILHRAVSPFIIEFYGAFFVEGCVYYCMEYMDAGSLDFFSGIDVDVGVLGRVTKSMVEGLRFLKNQLQIMHRDVKPTNVLINLKGEVKLCDFGVSGQLERSLAKTNIGCQSYMAPERIQGESLGVASTYTVASDVWSLGLSLVEFSIGNYPYPPETYSNVFAQLQAIVYGDPPNLPDRFGEEARDFVGRCLEKVPLRRMSYGEMLEHPFLIGDGIRKVDMVDWVNKAVEKVRPRNTVLV